MSELMVNNNLKKYLSLNALKSAQDRTWNKTIGNLIGIYYNVIKKNNTIST